MKINIEKNKLVEMLAIAGTLTKGTLSLPILSNVLVKIEKDQFQIKATNLNSGVWLTEMLEEKIEENVSFCISCSLLLEYVQTLASGQINLELKEEKLLISQMGSKAKLPVIKEGDYPDFLIEDDLKLITVNFVKFEKVIKRALVSVSVDESRPVLEGIYFKLEEEKLKVVSTDGYRLSISLLDFEGEWEGDLLAPAKSLNSLIKGIKEKELRMGFDKKNNQLLLWAENRKIAIRLISGDFPNFTKIIPEGQESRVVVDKEELSNMVAQMTVFARQNANIVKMQVGEKLKLSTQSGYVGSGEAEIDGKFEGEPLELAFNYRYLKEFLTVLPNSELEIIFNGSLAPVKFISSGIKDFLHIIMPVKV